MSGIRLPPLPDISLRSVRQASAQAQKLRTLTFWRQLDSISFPTAFGSCQVGRHQCCGQPLRTAWRKRIKERTHCMPEKDGGDYLQSCTHEWCQGMVVGSFCCIFSHDPILETSFKTGFAQMKPTISPIEKEVHEDGYGGNRLV
eukprot:5974181-Amphidinium_carterae.1